MILSIGWHESDRTSLLLFINCWSIIEIKLASRGKRASLFSFSHGRFFWQEMREMWPIAIDPCNAIPSPVDAGMWKCNFSDRFFVQVKWIDAWTKATVSFQTLLQQVFSIALLSIVSIRRNIDESSVERSRLKTREKLKKKKNKLKNQTAYVCITNVAHFVSMEEN